MQVCFSTLQQLLNSARLRWLCTYHMLCWCDLIGVQNAPMGSVVQIRVLNDEESKDAEPTESETDDVFLRKIEATLLTQVCTLCLAPDRVSSPCCVLIIACAWAFTLLNLPGVLQGQHIIALFGYLCGKRALLLVLSHGKVGLNSAYL